MRKTGPPMRLKAAQWAELQSLMEDCGQALYDDAEWNCPVYRDEHVVGSNGINPAEAASALNAVAAILGIDSPRDHYDVLCRATEDA